MIIVILFLLVGLFLSSIQVQNKQDTRSSADTLASAYCVSTILDDSFSGSTLDAAKWKVVISPGQLYGQAKINSLYQLVIASEGNNSRVEVQSIPMASGDFKAEVDLISVLNYVPGGLVSPYPSGNGFGALELYDPVSQARLTFNRNKDFSNNSEQLIVRANSTVIGTSSLPPNSSVVRVRITRSGNNYVFEYRPEGREYAIFANWINNSITLNSVKMILVAESHTTLTAATVDNFNSCNVLVASPSPRTYPSASPRPTPVTSTLPAPKLISAVPSCKSPSVKLSWSTVTGTTTYHVERCAYSTSFITKCSYSQIAADVYSPFTDTNVSSGVSYNYRVRAHDHKTNIYSPYSNVLSALVPNTCANY